MAQYLVGLNFQDYIEADSDRLGSRSDEELLVTFADCYMIVPVTSK